MPRRRRNHPAPPDGLSGSPIPWQTVGVLRAPAPGDWMQVKREGKGFVWAYLRHDKTTRQVTTCEDSLPSDLEAERFQRWARSVIDG